MSLRINMVKLKRHKFQHFQGKYKWTLYYICVQHGKESGQNNLSSKRLTIMHNIAQCMSSGSFSSLNMVDKS